MAAGSTWSGSSSAVTEYIRMANIRNRKSNTACNKIHSYRGQKVARSLLTRQIRSITKLELRSRWRALLRRTWMLARLPAHNTPVRGQHSPPASHVLDFFITNVFAHVSQNMMDLLCSWSGLVTLWQIQSMNNRYKQ